MKKYSDLRILPLSLALLLTLLTGCERRELEVDLGQLVRMSIIVNWRTDISVGVSEEDSAFFSDFYDGVPNGMTVMLWGQRLGNRYVKSSNGNSVDVLLPPDYYKLIVFNNSETDYLPYMRLFNPTSYDSIMMRSMHYTPTRSYWLNDYIYYPEPMAVALDSFEVTEDMVSKNAIIFLPYDEFEKNGELPVNEYERTFSVNEKPSPMTVNLSLKLKVRFRHSLKAIEASLSGMADGYYLTTVNRSSESGAIELSSSNWQYYAVGDPADSMGVIVNTTQAYGLPYGKELVEERDSTDNVLRLRVTIYNDSVMEYEFNVGKELRYLTPEGVEAQVRTREDLYNLQLELDVKDVIILPFMEGGGAGFSADVADWEEGGTIDVGGF